MRLMEIIQDVEFQIHMVIRGEFRTQAATMTEEGEMIHIERRCEIIGLVEEGLIARLAMGGIMRIISMGIWVILIINGIVRKAE